MTSPADYGLAEILDTVRRVLYGTETLPESPGGRLEFMFRQRIAAECPEIVAAMLTLRAQRHRRRKEAP